MDEGRFAMQELPEAIGIAIDHRFRRSFEKSDEGCRVRGSSGPFQQILPGLEAVPAGDSKLSPRQITREGQRGILREPWNLIAEEVRVAGRDQRHHLGIACENTSEDGTRLGCVFRRFGVERESRQEGLVFHGHAETVERAVKGPDVDAAIRDGQAIVVGE